MKQAPLDFSVRTHVRRGHHDTEAQAAAEAMVHASRTCALVLEALRRWGPMTDEQLREVTGIHSARRRRADLKNAGMVEDTGERRPTRQGKPSIVWRAV